LVIFSVVLIEEYFQVSVVYSSKNALVGC